MWLLKSLFIIEFPSPKISMLFLEIRTYFVAKPLLILMGPIFVLFCLLLSGSTVKTTYLVYAI
jgi:hypothetical protein